jgi:hypothetical protein
MVLTERTFYQVTHGFLLTSESLDSDGTETWKFEFLLGLFTTYLPTAFLVIGFVGNVLAYLTINALRDKGGVVAFHFKALAITDILATNSLIHAVVQQTAPELVIPWGVVFCKEYSFNSYYWYGVAVWCVVTLTLDRVIAVCFPLKASTWCTLKKGKICLAANIIIHIPLYFAYFWMQFYPPSENGITHNMCKLPDGFPSWVAKMENFLYQIFDSYIPMIFVSLGNMSILWSFFRTLKTKSQLIAATAQTPKEDTSIVVMLLTMSSAFIVFMLAYPVDYLFWDIFSHGLDSKYPDVRNLSYSVAYLISCCNNTFNFYMYLLSSSTFRQKFTKLLRVWVQTSLSAFKKGTFNIY